MHNYAAPPQLAHSTHSAQTTDAPLTVLCFFHFFVQGDLEEQAKLVAALGADHTAIRESAAHPLHFMYAPPPGMTKDKDHPSSHTSGLPIAVTGPSSSGMGPWTAAGSSSSSGGGGGKSATLKGSGSRGVGSLLASVNESSGGGGGGGGTDGGDEVAAFLARFSGTASTTGPVTEVPGGSGPTSSTGAPSTATATTTSTGATGVDAVGGGGDEGPPHTYTDSHTRGEKDMRPMQAQTELQKLAGQKLRPALTKEEMVRACSALAPLQ